MKRIIQIKLLAVPSNRLNQSAFSKINSPNQKLGRIPANQRQESETKAAINIPSIVIPVSFEIAKPSTRFDARATIMIATLLPNKTARNEQARITENES